MAKYNNKVVIGTTTIIDLTADTITADTVLTGKTAHGKNGAPITGSCPYDCDTSGGTANAEDVLSGKVAYSNGAAVTGTMASNGDTSGTISSVSESVTIPTGHTSGGTVSISADEKKKLVPGNIAQGVTVLGVTGTHEGTGKMQAKEATASFVEQTITPDSGYTGLSSVTINPVPYKTETNSTGGLTITIGG